MSDDKHDDLTQREPATRAVHAGLPAPEPGAPMMGGPVFAAPFHAAGDPADSPFTYARFSTPTWEAYESALGELEGGAAVTFSSGMAAISAVMLPLLVPGDAVVVPSDGYYQTRALAREHFEPRGIEVRAVPTDDDAILAAIPGARLVMVETPSNPGLDVCDIASLAAAAHEQDALLCVDNSLVTPLGQSPLELGADLSMCSGTKSLSGHSDILMGHVASRDAELLARVRAWRTLTGAVPGPFEAWLAHRSLATLELRLERQSANALALAQLLCERPEVSAVRYPGLPGDAAHEIASAQMRRFGPVLGFVLPDAAHAQRFLSASVLVAEATSFGGVHSSAERRARWGTDDIAEGWIRFSAGCEAIDDLRADVTAALDAAG